MNHPRFRAGDGPRRPGWLRTLTVLAAVFLCLLGAAQAQLSGTYTIGGSSANYPSIEAAIDALVANGIGSSVIFTINDGTYTPPTGGYRLPSINLMTSTTTVTFRPASGASVVIDGSAEMGVFQVVGNHYILDGANSTDGSTRDWRIVNRNTDYPAIAFYDGAHNNTVRNMVLISGSYDQSRAVVAIGPDGSSQGGTSYNTIINNTIGDPTGAMRSVCGIWCGGIPADGMRNIGNRIEGNDIVNCGKDGTPAFGVYVTPGNRETLIRNNRISVDNKEGFAAESFGIVIDNPEDAQNDSISGNRIWNLQGSNHDAVQVAITVNYTSGASIAIHDNMVSLFTDGDGYMGGIQIATNGGTAYAHNNSVNIMSTGRGPSQGGSNAVNIIEGSTVTLANNVLVNLRPSRYRESNGVINVNPNVALTSNYNLLYVDGPGTWIGYDGSNTQVTFADWQSTGQDANSVTTSPRFVDPLVGDLHISTTERTPVEGRGTPIAGLTHDFDGDERDATTPDIGADEGSFLPLIDNDMELLAVIAPIDGGVLRSATAFSPNVTVLNLGNASQSSVTVRFQIIDRSTSTVVYEDAKTTGTLAQFESETITFAETGSITGSTSLPTGDYEIRTWTELANDGDRNSDSAFGRVTVKSPLSGTYTIDQNGSGDRNFTTFTAAAVELSEVGIEGAVRFEIADGTYGERSGETFPITIGKVQGSSSSSTVTFVPAAGALPVVESSLPVPAFDLSGADWVHFDGSNSGSPRDRSWTIISSGMNDGTAIRLVNGAQNNVIENMYLIGGQYSPAVHIGENLDGTDGNSYNTIINNTIGDSTGRTRGRYGVFMIGSSGADNTGNRIEKNEIINFGSDYDTGWGIYIEGANLSTSVVGNSIHVPVKDGANGSSVGIYYGVWENPGEDTISYNRIWDLSTNADGAEFSGITVRGQAPGSSLVIHDNMISIVDDEGYLFGLVLSPYEGATYVYNNSIYIGGSSRRGVESHGVRVENGTITAMNNIVANMRTSSSGRPTNAAISRGWGDATVRSDYNLIYAGGSGTIFALIQDNEIGDLDTWRGMTFLDAHSVSVQPPFVDANGGDLHLRTDLVFAGESAGTPVADEADFDNEDRDPVRPDIGADEGEFNGGGITVVYPNGGENLVAGYETEARFETNRPMSVTYELSTDDGATWTPAGSADLAEAGVHTVTITTPDVLTSTARFRVISARNQYEADTSDNAFNLVNPIMTLVSPNGAERWIAGDVYPVRWNSEYLPSVLTANLELSTDNGGTWTEIATGLRSDNLPGTNSFDWTVPNVPTDQALIRVVVPGITATDRSNATFTIIEQPSVHLLAPVTGAKRYAGDRDTIRWSSTTTDNVTLEYSLDGGTTWTEIAHRVPAYLASLAWTIPGSTTANAIVRITSTERPRYSDQTGAFSILRSQIRVSAPNGGEGFEPNAPVTVTWTSSDVQHVRVEFSADNGVTWTAVASGIDAALGTATFTPPQTPTKKAFVRVVDEDRPASRDASDAAFEILQPKSITLFSPAAGDGFGRNSTTVIYWRSVRLSTLNIYYSSDGGDSWDLVASNVSAPAGTYTWTVPNQNTENGRIRLTEVGGSIVVESGRFSIVDPSTPTLRVLAPNGGESFSIGEMATILWNASGISAPLTVAYSADGGSSWTTITTSAQASAGQYQWLLTGINPGSSYRVRVSGPSVSDASDANFAVKAQLNPAITLTNPNGGEIFTVGDSRSITWTATDVFGNFAVSYSTDDGATWTDITIVPANASGAGSYSAAWTVPNAPTSTARVRVMASSASDASDATFQIKAREILPVVVTSPNGGETWTSGDSRKITWTAPNDIANVKIDYSLDGGSTWTNVVGTTPNDGSFDWTVPSVSASVSEAVVRVYDVTDGLRMDMSDAPFTINPKVIEPIRVITPNGGELLTSNDNYQVTFAVPADVASVWVYFSRDNGTTWEPVAGPLPAASGSYTWRVPTVPAQLTTAKIRIVDAADASRKDESDATFTINPGATTGVSLEHGVAGGSGISLSGNYPNPFAGTTELRWTQQVGGQTTLLVFRGNGVVVRNVSLGSLEAGAHSYQLEGDGLPSGAYYYELRSGTAFARGMMMIAR